MNSTKPLHILSLIWVILSTGCTFDTTKTIDPVFTLSLDSISREINSIILTPEASVVGKEISTDGDTRNELTINLINSKRVPAETSEQKKIGEYVAIIIRNRLKDPNSFTDFKVLFTKRLRDGNLTRSTYKGYSYKSKDLKPYVQIVSIGDQIDRSTLNAIGKTSFSINDPKIISVFTYYNNVPGSPIKFNMYKETDSASILFISSDQEPVLAGNHYLRNEIKTAEFYNRKKLGSGKYRIEYLVSDTVAGSKYFNLQ